MCNSGVERFTAPQACVTEFGYMRQMPTHLGCPCDKKWSHRSHIMCGSTHSDNPAQVCNPEWVPACSCNKSGNSWAQHRWPMNWCWCDMHMTTPHCNNGLDVQHTQSLVYREFGTYMVSGHMLTPCYVLTTPYNAIARKQQTSSQDCHPQQSCLTTFPLMTAIPHINIDTCLMLVYWKTQIRNCIRRGATTTLDLIVGGPSACVWLSCDHTHL